MYCMCQIHDQKISVELIEDFITLSAVPINYNVIIRLDFGFRLFRIQSSVLKPVQEFIAYLLLF